MSPPERPKKIEIENAFWAVCLAISAASLLSIALTLKEVGHLLVERFK